MKVFTCICSAVNAEILWDVSMKNKMTIHYVGKEQKLAEDPILYTYEVTMDEEDALIMILSNSGISLAAK